MDRKCSSGLNAVAFAARGIIANEIDVAVAGGMESISLTLNKHAPAYRNRSEFVRAHDPHAYMAMIETAEIVAERYGISREDQDHFAAQSQQRAAAAQAAGRFDDEIVPITVAKALFDKEGNETGKQDVTIAADEGVRAGTTYEALAGLKPVFKGGAVIAEGRNITAGNASQLSDGASAQVLMDLAMAQREPVGVILGIAPWNAPIILGVRAIAVPLACGNAVILKASETCPRTHALIIEAFAEAGFPEGVVQVVTNARPPAIRGASPF
eukprot:gene11328-14478_t